MTSLTGELFVGAERRARDQTFTAYEPSLGQPIGTPPFSIARTCDVSDACALAEAAFPVFSTMPLLERAAFLDAIADEIEAIGDPLVERACRETGLSEARIESERARTVLQLRFYAEEVRDGSWQRVRIEHGDSDRTPPRPDLRLRMVPIGPIAIFGASNFPLAFSAAGGDTAAALAAGCPVIVKGHSAHPGTCEMMAGTVRAAAERTGMPEGIYSMLLSNVRAVGEALVTDLRICAVGFTGSRAGGEALMRLASARPCPIPVFAEMASINPVLLLPAALAARSAPIAEGFVASLTLGAGQFCTNPGLILALEGPDLDAFIARTHALLAHQDDQVMLTSGIHAAFEQGKVALSARPGIATVAEGLASGKPTRGAAALYKVGASDFIADPQCREELFGSASLVVVCRDVDDMTAVLDCLEGQLTGTIHADEADHELARYLLPWLERRAGRLIVNGWPTGVEVSHAMVHGGGYPSTSDGRSTSVGSLAIDRFLRPVSYQNVPAALLPDALREQAQRGVARIDGRWEFGESRR